MIRFREVSVEWCFSYHVKQVHGAAAVVHPMTVQVVHAPQQTMRAAARLEAQRQLAPTSRVPRPTGYEPRMSSCQLCCGLHLERKKRKTS